NEALGLLKASTTASNNTVTQLQSQLHDALVSALNKIGKGDVITVGLSGGALSLSSSISGLHFRGNNVQVSLSLPDLFDEFKQIDFSLIIKGLQFVVNFHDGIPAAAAVLDANIPLINKSINDIVSIVGKVSDLLDELNSNPAASVQKLETLLEGKLGAPSLGHYVAFDA